MIAEINESRTLTKHISWKCECKFDDRKYNLNQKWNNDKCRCECKNFKKNKKTSCVREKLFLESCNIYL